MADTSSKALDACRAALLEGLRVGGVRATENIDLDRLTDDFAKARVLGRSLMEHGDGRAFLIGRRLKDLGESRSNGTD